VSPTVVHAVGARPNFVKMAPVVDALASRSSIRQLIVHTGQHYDRRMSEDVLADVRLPEPDVHLGVGSGTHAEQTGRALIEFERVLVDERPDLVVVAGDVNSTLACALAAAKLEIPVAHVEAGLRSGDWSMPEEVNRVLTDRLSDLLFTHSPEAAENLAREGVPTERVHYVGNTMIDTLRAHEQAARERAAWRPLGVSEGEYVLATLHRPSNVDDPHRLGAIVGALCELARRAPIVAPLHPRTREHLQQLGAVERLEEAGVRLTPPLGYLDFLSLQLAAGAILTDSGGIQEEAAALGVSCYTLRPNTERPITITHGTNTLLGEAVSSIAQVCVSGRPPTPCAIPLWDGVAGERIAGVIAAQLAESARAAAVAR
jgi:UDP-N-acetylglucosamine 2-epimerase (non-hydrolysing)